MIAANDHEEIDASLHSDRILESGQYESSLLIVSIIIMVYIDAAWIINYYLYILFHI